MKDWSVSIHVKTRNRRGPTVTVGLRLEEPIRLSDRLVLRNDPTSGSTDVIAEILAQGETGEQAIERAFTDVTEAAAVVGFASGVGLVPERSGLVAVLPGDDGKPAEVRTTGGLDEAVDLAVTQSTSEITDAYARFNELSSEDRSRAGALMELLSMGDQENSPRARFLTYMTILDSLSPPAEETPAAAEFIDEVSRAIKAAFASRTEPETKALLGRFTKRLGEVLTESTRSRLARLLLSAGLSKSVAEEKAIDLWKLRNDMSHGSSPVDQGRVEFSSADARNLAVLCIGHRFLRPVRARD